MAKRRAWRAGLRLVITSSDVRDRRILAQRIAGLNDLAHVVVHPFDSGVAWRHAVDLVRIPHDFACSPIPEETLPVISQFLALGQKAYEAVPDSQHPYPHRPLQRLACL